MRNSQHVDIFIIKISPQCQLIFKQLSVDTYYFLLIRKRLKCDLNVFRYCYMTEHDMIYELCDISVYEMRTTESVSSGLFAFSVSREH